MCFTVRNLTAIFSISYSTQTLCKYLTVVVVVGSLRYDDYGLTMIPTCVESNILITFSDYI